MSTIITVLSIIWVFLNFCLFGLFLYIKYLGSKKHMSLFESRVERVRRKFSKMQKG